MKIDYDKILEQLNELKDYYEERKNNEKYSPFPSRDMLHFYNKKVKGIENSIKSIERNKKRGVI